MCMYEQMHIYHLHVGQKHMCACQLCVRERACVRAYWLHMCMSIMRVRACVCVCVCVSVTYVHVNYACACVRECA